MFMEHVETGHFPVLKKQVLFYINLKKGGVYIDATYGRGGHSACLLESEKSISLYALDKDMEAVMAARERFRGIDNFKAIHSGFEDIDQVIEREGITRLDGVIFDIGFSSCQIKDGERGFSFQEEGPIDMRYDRSKPLTAWEIINRWDRNNLIWIFENYGEINKSRKLADAIIERRKAKKFESTLELAGFISEYYGYRKKIHPATKVFMALRIAVNDELEALRKGLDKAGKALSEKGRLVVISFHSLEDRIVKRYMKETPFMKIITKRPVSAEEEELDINPESRSAKLRAAEKNEE